MYGNQFLLLENLQGIYIYKVCVCMCVWLPKITTEYKGKMCNL